MRILYLDCGMGAAGDMLTAALLELLPEPERFVERLNGLGIPGVEFRMEAAEKCGIRGTHMSVLIHGEEEAEHHHGHDNDHSHHHHNSLHDLEHLIRDHLTLSPKVQADVLAVYQLIAEAESRVHGVPVTEIHFHEVGTMDALADITAVCLLMEELAPEKVLASPVHVGSGSVRCAHGILPVPAPATAQILQGVPVYGGAIQGELCTPTGAALLKHFVTSFGEMPVMQLSAVGYGMGKKDFERANCVRAMLGETAECGDSVYELACNLDDMTGEKLGFAMEQIFAAGAVDAYTTPIGMKKSRPGILLGVLCRAADKEAVLSAIFRHTTTLGVREQELRRHVLARRQETISTPYGDLRLKLAEGYGVRRAKWEYDDLAALAAKQGCSMEALEKELAALLPQEKA